MDEPPLHADTPMSEPPRAEQIRMQRAFAMAQWSVTGLKLTLRGWLLVAMCLVAASWWAPHWWSGRLPSAFRMAEYRVPFGHSEDYWLAGQSVDEARRQDLAVMLGDSVVWGAYAAPGDAWSAALHRADGSAGLRNLGLNGLHPIAMQGLVEHCLPELRSSPVLLHCNPLWMSSPRVDGSGPQSDLENHADLAPLLWHTLPGERRSVALRMAAVVNRQSAFLRWGRHLRLCVLDGQDLPNWTLDDPYGWPVVDWEQLAPAQGPHYPPRSWLERRLPQLDAPWVAPGDSRQWQAFCGVWKSLSNRDNRVLVVLGPLNEQMLTPASRLRYRHWLDTAEQLLRQLGADWIRPQPLASASYADISHPVASGYQELAGSMVAEPRYIAWQKK